MNFNKAIIVGNITRDPELRKTAKGLSVCVFSVATNRVWNDKDGQKQQDTQFHNVVAYGKIGETIHQYMKKGSEILVEGRNVNRSWDDKDGNKKYRHEIVLETFQFGASPKGKTGHQEPQTGAGEPTGGDVGGNVVEDDIPLDSIPF